MKIPMARPQLFVNLAGRMVGSEYWRIELMGVVRLVTLGNDK